MITTNLSTLMEKSNLGLEESAVLLIIYELQESDKTPEEIYTKVMELNMQGSITTILNILDTLLYISVDKIFKKIILRSKALKILEPEKESIEKIIEYLNSKTGRRFSTKNSSNVKLIKSRLKEGYTVEDCMGVIDTMVLKWGSDKKMRYYLRPETLFNSTKFQTYYNLYKELEVTSDENDWTIEKV